MNISFPTANLKYAPLGVVLVILNLFDALGTVLHVDSQEMYEYSPITAPLVSYSSYAFIAVKMLIVMAAVLLILRSRPKLIKVAFAITLPVYVALTVWHIVLFTYYGV